MGFRRRWPPNISDSGTENTAGRTQPAVLGFLFLPFLPILFVAPSGGVFLPLPLKLLGRFALWALRQLYSSRCTAGCTARTVTVRAGGPSEYGPIHVDSPTFPNETCAGLPHSPCPGAEIASPK